MQLLVIAGPTATGKTGLAVALARALDAEIVGADSMQVYRGLDIGTGKATPDELGDVRHWLIDVVDPDEPFDAARFVTEADRAIADIESRGKRALLVGGTGLYIRAVLHGLHQGPAPDPAVRARISAFGVDVGWPALHAKLAEVDPETAQKLHPNDGVRIVRALEVFELSGIPISEWQRQHRFEESRYPTLLLGLDRPRPELHRRIDERVDRMIDAGFVDEVRGLLAAGCSAALRPMQGLGYRRLCEHLEGRLSLDEAVEQIKVDTRRFARRQFTWFRREQGLEWVHPDDDGILERAGRFFEEG